ncbi:MAG TPA: trypsin-like peptidase domain-containing protein [Stellaceae bacterium]|nr:trypsin-like peptidase domain-containing protein [Stellaceae bacterium]
MTLPRALAVLATASLAASALAAEPDRSSLSYEDNVSINTACHAAIAQGSDAFAACVTQQMAALKTHPAPDRTALGEAQARAIEDDCAYLRLQGVAPYNDCLTKAVATEPAAASDEDKDALVSVTSLAKALTGADDAPPSVTAPSLPLPKTVLPAIPGHPSHAALSPEALYKEAERSVFVVGAARSVGDARARDIMQGSAVAITDHLLLTNCHVVQDRPVIVLLQDRVSYRASLVAADPKADRCVLKSEGAALTPVAGVRLFDSVAVGEPVYAIGAPRGLERTLTEGLVSAMRPGKERNLIQTSAPLSPGSSGGGLFDEYGNLVGITTLASLPGSQNLNFAIAAADFWTL